MKKWVWILWMFVALVADAYQVGGVSRPNFSSSAGMQENSSVVPAQTAVQTRSFTSYGSRPGNGWRQGVKTQTVQTQTATDVAQKNKDLQAKDPVAEPVVVDEVVKPVSQPKETPKKGEKSGSYVASYAKPADQPGAKESPAQPTNQAEATGAMQQLQNLQGMMGAMTGGRADSGAGSAASPAGMPDISALMKAAQGESKK